MQGTVKQGLQRQKEAYSGKWRDLEEKARGLEDALRSVRQAVAEREEQNVGLDAQVRRLPSALQFAAKSSDCSSSSVVARSLNVELRMAISEQNASLILGSSQRMVCQFLALSAGRICRSSGCHVIPLIYKIEWFQVGQLEEEVAGAKRAMDADLREKAAEAERLKAAVEELRNATSHTVADSEAAILSLQAWHLLHAAYAPTICSAVEEMSMLAAGARAQDVPWHTIDNITPETEISSMVYCMTAEALL